MNINNFVDEIYCINLDKRTDRWERCKNIFKNNNLNVERFSAIDGSKLELTNNKLLPGEVGIIKSNLEIVKLAKENKYKSVLIFEDDVELCDNFNELFDLYIKQVPNNWSFIYLGGNHVGGYTHVSENVALINHSFAIHAFIINENIYDHIITMLQQEKEQVDVTYAKLQKIFPSYVFRPHLAWQKDGHSDIQGGYQNYDFLKK